MPKAILYTKFPENQILIDVNIISTVRFTCIRWNENDFFFNAIFPESLLQKLRNRETHQRREGLTLVSAPVYYYPDYRQ